MIRLGLRAAVGACAAVLAIGPAHAALVQGERIKAVAPDADMGTIAPGKLANMIVLAKDPLADIENLKSLELTIKRGRTYPRTDFKLLTEQNLKDAQ